MKFLALNVDFSSLSPDALRLTRPAYAGAKERYPLKSGYFSDIGLSSVKMVGTDTLLIITGTGDLLFSRPSINIDDLE